MTLWYPLTSRAPRRRGGAPSPEISRFVTSPLTTACPRLSTGRGPRAVSYFSALEAGLQRACPDHQLGVTACDCPAPPLPCRLRSCQQGLSPEPGVLSAGAGLSWEDPGS